MSSNQDSSKGATVTISAVDNPIVRSWLISERKYTTFQNLYESHNLSFEQVKRLKLAQACYEVVPSAIMTPFVY